MDTRTKQLTLKKVQIPILSGECNSFGMFPATGTKVLRTEEKRKKKTIKRTNKEWGSEEERREKEKEKGKQERGGMTYKLGSSQLAVWICM